MSHIEQISLAYLTRKFKLMIDAPPEAVWPHMLDFEKFNQTFERVEVLSGERNCVGTVSRLIKEEGEWYMPPYLVKIIELVPNEKIVWKMFPDQGDSFFGFVEFSLTEVEGKTEFYNGVYFEYLLPKMADDAIAEFEEKIQHDYAILEKKIFNKLKELSEGNT